MKEHFYISSYKYNLQERQTKKNGKVYDVVFRVVTLSGEVHQKRLSGYKTKSLARDAYTAYVEENCEFNKYSAQAVKRVAEKGKTELTVSKIFPVYLTSLRNNNKDSSIYDKGNIYRKHIKPYLGDYNLRDLSKEVLFSYQENLWQSKNTLTNTYYSYRYLSKVRTVLNNFLTYAEEKYAIQNNYKYVKKPKPRITKKEMQFWTREEFDSFISNVDDPTYKTLFSLLFFTGRRKGEILALTPADVQKDAISFTKSLSRKTLDGSPYAITSTKNEKHGSTPICKPLQLILQQYKPSGKFYFGGDYPLSDSTITRRFQEYCKIANVKIIKIHGLRHSFVSMLIHLGASIYVIADLIGDTVEQVLKTYGHLYAEDKLKIISSIS